MRHGQGDLRQFTTAVARAAQRRDAAAEAEARSALAAARVRRELEAAHRSGVTFTREQGEVLCEAVAGVTDGASAAVSHGRVSVTTDPVPHSPRPRPGTAW